MNIEAFIHNLPKAELHMHIEGSFEPELMFAIAKRNNIKLKYTSIDDIKKAYQFSSLQDFLNIYYEGMNVLITEKDFYDLAWDYFEKAKKQNVLHTEIFFDPQAHTQRGIAFSTIINGLHHAMEKANQTLGISSQLIMCFLRDVSVQSAHATLEAALPYKNWICAVGLDSAEVGNPPNKFKDVFQHAKEYGFLTVAHAGEEGPSEYIWQAINELNVQRIDHGNHCLDDSRLVIELVARQIPLTLCPLSNLKLAVINDLKNHPLKILLDKGIRVTINSDDPAYFGGYVNENYIALAKHLDLTRAELYQIAKNSFLSSFLPERKKQALITKLDDYINTVEK